jgi:hypothetical protein
LSFFNFLEKKIITFFIKNADLSLKKTPQNDKLTVKINTN